MIFTPYFDLFFNVFLKQFLYDIKMIRSDQFGQGVSQRFIVFPNAVDSGVRAFWVRPFRRSF